MNTNLDNAKDKDAELARWREQALQEDATANVLRNQVASLSSLIKELADVAERFISCKATECETVCGGDERCIHKKAITLVAKARRCASEN